MRSFMQEQRWVYFVICYILIESLAWCNHVCHSFSTQLMTPLSFLYSFSGDALCILILLLLQILRICMFLQRLLGKLFSVSFQYLEIFGEKKTLLFESLLQNFLICDPGVLWRHTFGCTYAWWAHILSMYFEHFHVNAVTRRLIFEYKQWTCIQKNNKNKNMN